MAIFPLAPDQTIAQMWSSGVRGAATANCEHGIAETAMSIQQRCLPLQRCL